MACGPAPRPEISPSRRCWPDSGRCHDIHTRRPAGIRRLVPSHGQRAQSTRACSSFAHRRRARQSETLRDTPELRSRTASTHPEKRPFSVIPAEHVRQSCYTIRACRTMNPCQSLTQRPDFAARISSHRHRSERSSDRRPRTADVHRPHRRAGRTRACPQALRMPRPRSADPILAPAGHVALLLHERVRGRGKPVSGIGEHDETEIDVAHRGVIRALPG